MRILCASPPSKPCLSRPEPVPPSCPSSSRTGCGGMAGHAGRHRTRSPGRGAWDRPSLETRRPGRDHPPLPRRAGPSTEILGANPSPPSTALRLARSRRLSWRRPTSMLPRRRSAPPSGSTTRLGEALVQARPARIAVGPRLCDRADCHQGLSCNLTEPQREALDKFKALVDRFASSGRRPDRASP